MNSVNLSKSDFELVEKKILQKVISNNDVKEEFKANPKKLIESTIKELYPENDYSIPDDMSVFVIDESKNNLVIKLPDLNKAPLPDKELGCWGGAEGVEVSGTFLSLGLILKEIENTFTEKALLDSKFKEELLKNKANAINIFKDIMYELWPNIEINPRLENELEKMCLIILDCPEQNTYYEIDSYTDKNNDTLVNVNVESTLLTPKYEESLYKRYYVIPK